MALVGCLSCVVDVVRGESEWVGNDLLFRHGTTSTSPQQAVEILVLPEFFTADKRLVLLEMRQRA